MSKQKNSIYVMILLLASLTISCHKHKDPDPCSGKNPVSSSFNTEEQFSYVVHNWTPYNTNTVNTNVVTFTALEENATYKWLIGAGVYTDQSTTITFPDSFLTGMAMVPVTLIVNKDPDKSCFPNDDGKDTITKYIHFTNTTLTLGKFQGYWESDPSVTFTVNINYKQISSIPGDVEVYFQGFDRDTCGIFASNTEIAYKEIVFATYASSTCSTLNGKAMIGSDDNSITIDYTSENPSHVKNTYKFIGNRVP